MADKLNLNRNTVNFYWKTQDKRMSKILSMMEDVEHWVVDDSSDDVAKELISFGKKLSSITSTGLSKKSDDITTVMTYILSSKSLRLLNWIDDSFPGVPFHYIMEAKSRDNWEPGKLLLDRLITIRTLSLLGLIFAPMRTKLISSLLENDDEDYDDDIE